MAICSCITGGPTVPRATSCYNTLAPENAARPHKTHRPHAASTTRLCPRVPRARTAQADEHAARSADTAGPAAAAGTATARTATAHTATPTRGTQVSIDELHAINITPPSPAVQTHLFLPAASISPSPHPAPPRPVPSHPSPLGHFATLPLPPPSAAPVFPSVAHPFHPRPKRKDATARRSPRNTRRRFVSLS